jgi:hypothetical protein
LFSATLVNSKSGAIDEFGKLVNDAIDQTFTKENFDLAKEGPML